MVIVRFVLFCTDVVNDFLSKNCQYIAGAISFYTLFAVFPLILAIASILAYVGPRSEEEKLELARDISEVIPVSNEYVSETVEGMVRARLITGIASLLVVLWASSAAFGAIRKGINAAWGITKPRPFLKERMIDVALVLGAGMIMLSVLFSGPAVSVSREIANELAPESQLSSDLIWRMIADLLSPAASFLAFLVLYRFLPNAEVRLRDVWPGALLASIAFEGLKLAFVWYVSKYTPYNLVYGSVGAILALLTWVYLSAIIVLSGAIITSRYAAYAASIKEMEGEEGLKLLWTGFSRVRLRVVESTGMV